VRPDHLPVNRMGYNVQDAKSYENRSISAKTDWIAQIGNFLKMVEKQHPNDAPHINSLKGTPAIRIPGAVPYSDQIVLKISSELATK
jgi:hypothetical protein